MTIVRDPAAGWVKTLKAGDVVWMVKEESRAMVLSSYREGDSLGNIRIRKFDTPDEVWWSVSADGNGYDGLPILQPMVREEVTPPPNLSNLTKMLQRKLKKLSDDYQVA